MSEGDDRRVWIVTGGSSGFGQEISHAALSRGARAVATARRAERGWRTWSAKRLRGLTPSRST